jgi:hypothetical protein
MAALFLYTGRTQPGALSQAAYTSCLLPPASCLTTCTFYPIPYTLTLLPLLEIRLQSMFAVELQYVLYHFFSGVNHFQ